MAVTGISADAQTLQSLVFYPYLRMVSRTGEREAMRGRPRLGRSTRTWVIMCRLATLETTVL